MGLPNTPGCSSHRAIYLYAYRLCGYGWLTGRQFTTSWCRRPLALCTQESLQLLTLNVFRSRVAYLEGDKDTNIKALVRDSEFHGIQPLRFDRMLQPLKTRSQSSQAKRVCQVREFLAQCRRCVCDLGDYPP